jgi:hypothetical protein
MAKNTEKLISLGGDALGPSPSHHVADVLLTGAGALGRELLDLLFRKNGFYAFESALHVFPIGKVPGVMDLLTWNSNELWKRDYGPLIKDHIFFAEDLFGAQYCISGGKVCFFDPETGETETVCSKIEDWAGLILADYEFRTGFPLAHSWQEQHGALPVGSRLLPKIPFVCGGQFAVKNLYLLDSTRGMKLRASLAQQIVNLPDGAKINFEVVH